MSAFPAALAHEVLIFDGAMGTEIYRHHVFTNRSFDELCLSDPALIRGIHEEYLAAGADVLTTNTFGASRSVLEKFGLGERRREINLAGAKLAREVAAGAGRPVFVAGSVGPVPFLPGEERQAVGQMAEQIEALTEGGVDFILFETQPSRAALENCMAAICAAPSLPYVLSFSVGESGETASGETVDRVMAAVPDHVPPPAAWGLNCGVGPDGLLGAVERAVQLTRMPLVVMPNAGIPRAVESRRIYFCSPEYLAEYAKRYIALGAAAVGGCCGTTPEHIREMARAVKPLARIRSRTSVLQPVETSAGKEPAALAEKSRLGWKLAHRQWVTTVELLPPRGYDLSDTLRKSKMLHRHGVDAINIPDGPRASSRISPLITALRIQREAQIEAILHFCCRDRNLIGMQADLLACAACEIRNILFVTGDPPKLGNYPDATGVFDADSIGMAAVQRRLNCGLDLGGQPIDPQTYAAIGVGLDPTALDPRRELERFRRKVEVGAEFAITQPVFDPDALLRLLDQVQPLGIPILAGIWPLASLRNASFMRNEVPGVVIPDEIMERMAEPTTREGQLAAGVAIAREAVERIRDRVAGIQVSAPLGKIETALAVLGMG